MHPCVHSSTIHNSQDMEKPKCLSTDEWVKMMYVCACVCVYIYIYTYIYTHTYNGAILRYKRMKIMPFAATWIDLEIIILSEVKKSRTLPSHLYVEFKIRHRSTCL